MLVQHTPAMSVIVITPDSYSTVRKTIRRLRAQSVSHQLEIVLVVPSAQGANIDYSDLGSFHGVRILEIANMHSTARARAAGVYRATAPVVAFVEDHSFPAKGWAEALIRAHQKPWAAVGPMMANANPHSLVSWANLIIEYSEWMEPVSGGVAEHLPGHNGTYKRALLLEYGDRLEAMLEAESILQWDLRAKGHRLYLEPAAKTYHQNFSAPFSWLPLRLDGGRLFAASRSRTWPLLKRLLYALAAPLIPVVRFRRAVGEMRRPGRARHLMPRVLPLLFAGLVVDGTGEMIGYAFGPGNAMRRLSDMEFHRERYLTTHDRFADIDG
jgi:glycosyl transferase family 2